MMNTEPELSEQERTCLAVTDPSDCAGPITSEPFFAKCSSLNPVIRRRLCVNSSTRARVGLYSGSPLSQTPGVFGNTDCGNAIPVNKNSPANAPAAKDTLRPGATFIVFISHFSCSILFTVSNRSLGRCGYKDCRQNTAWPLARFKACFKSRSTFRSGTARVSKRAPISVQYRARKQAGAHALATAYLRAVLRQTASFVP